MVGPTASRISSHGGGGMVGPTASRISSHGGGGMVGPTATVGLKLVLVNAARANIKTAAALNSIRKNRLIEINSLCGNKPNGLFRTIRKVSLSAFIHVPI
jgi:hypothetical protein